MNLSDHVMSSNPNEVESALELSAFFLRYHRAVDYGDFSDNAYVVQRIRRFVDYKYWAEIEKLDGKHETLDGSFHQFKAAT